MPDKDGGLPGVVTLATAIDSNSSRAAAPRVGSIGFRTAALRHRALNDTGILRIAEQFLLNTRLERNSPETLHSIAGYFTDPAVVMMSLQGAEYTTGARTLTLPRSQPLRMQLSEAIGRRRSVRSFTGDAVDYTSIATLLRSGGGITGQAQVDIGEAEPRRIGFRAVPSGGGLYPIELVIAALNVKSLGKGLYRYNPRGDLLVEIGNETALTRLMTCFSVNEDMIAMSRAGAIFLMVGRPWKTMRKYGDRGMRFVFMESGCIAQNIHLAAVALGLGSVDCGAVFDDEVHSVLNIDGTFEALIHTLVVGTSGEA